MRLPTQPPPRLTNPRARSSDRHPDRRDTPAIRESGEEPDSRSERTRLNYLRDRVLRLKHHTGGEGRDRSNQFDLHRRDLSVGNAPITCTMSRPTAGQELPKGIAVVDREHPEATGLVAKIVETLSRPHHPLQPAGHVVGTIGSDHSPAVQSASIHVCSAAKQGGVDRSSPMRSPAR